MNTVKRIGTAALLAIGATLLAGTPGSAAYKQNFWNVGDEPEATGVASSSRWTIVGYYYWGPYDLYPIEECTLSISCGHLTPGGTYITDVGTFVANRSGNGKVSGRFCPLWDMWYADGQVTVARLNADGSSTVVLGMPSPW